MSEGEMDRLYKLQLLKEQEKQAGGGEEESGSEPEQLTKQQIDDIINQKESILKSNKEELDSL